MKFHEFAEKIEFHMIVHSITNVDAVNSILSIKFNLVLTWQDDRLEFQDLKQNTVLARK